MSHLLITPLCININLSLHIITYSRIFSYYTLKPFELIYIYPTSKFSYDGRYISRQTLRYMYLLAKTIRKVKFIHFVYLLNSRTYV